VRDFAWTRTPWIRLAAVVLAYLIVCGVLSQYDIPSGLNRGLSWGRFPLFAIALSHWLLPLDRNFRYLSRSLILLLALVSLDTLIQFLTGTSLSGNHPGSYANRLTGPFGDKMVVGLFLTRLAWPAIGLAFAASWTQPSLIRRFGPGLALAALFGITILLSGERMAFGLFLLTATLFWLGAKGMRLVLLGAGVVMAVAACGIVFFNPLMHDRFLTTTAPVVQNFDDSPYGAILGNALKTWELDPVTGVGPKNFVAACEKEGPKLGFRSEAPGTVFNCARHPHNIYLEWLAETGVIGLALFIGLIGLWGREVYAGLRHTSLPHYIIVLGFGVGLVPFLWPLMTSMSFFINWSAILFWWVLGLALVRRAPAAKV
ncbi:MAG: O-antigen polymerase, partial [Alphaproteobacteria bacterium]|nr:O-antigen polymerase [Alphaproteobacteria bacterium]